MGFHLKRHTASEEDDKQLHNNSREEHSLDFRENVSFKLLKGQQCKEDAFRRVGEDPADSMSRWTL